VLVASVVWAVLAITRSGFWADDFLNLTSFNHSLGNLSDDHINTGKYVINAFWALGTTLFGQGSVVPYLLLNAAVLAAGVVLWLWSGIGSRWSRVQAVWIAGLFAAGGTWWASALWSSNITHTAALLWLGAGSLCAERAVRASSLRQATAWTLCAGAAWTLTVASNLAYVGVLVLATWLLVGQLATVRRHGGAVARCAALAAWSLAVPLAYFVLIAYPATTSSSAYSQHGLSFISSNFAFYRRAYAPHLALSLLYLGLIALCLAGAWRGARHRRWFPLVALLSAVAMLVPALVQGQQREVNYVAVSVLVLVSGAVAGLRELAGAVPLRRRRFAIPAACAAGALALVLLIDGSASQRSYFLHTPYGRSLAAFRAGAAHLVPSGAALCSELDLDEPTLERFVAELSGPRGFQVPPVRARSVAFVSRGEPCPAADSSAIAVRQNPGGSFTATACPRREPIISPAVPLQPRSRRRKLGLALGVTAASAALASCGGSSTSSTTAAPSATTTTAPTAIAPVAGVRIVASPNPVPPGAGRATTTIKWSTKLTGGVTIRVSFNGAAPKLFAEGGGSGSAPAAFIVAGNRYRFLLYDATNPARPVAAVDVTRRQR
jgi:hypothetical protein